MERAQVLALLRGDWMDAGVIARLTHADYVGIADEAREKCHRPRILIPPRHMGARLKIPMTTHVPDGAVEVSDGVRVWFRLDLEPRAEGETLYHGISHVLAERYRRLHTEADVWGIFAELVFPRTLAMLIHSADRAVRLQQHVSRDILDAIILGHLRRMRLAA